MKVPLVGGSGRVLWDNLGKYADIKRRGCYVTNVIKRQIAGKFDDQRASVSRASACTRAASGSTSFGRDHTSTR